MFHESKTFSFQIPGKLSVISTAGDVVLSELLLTCVQGISAFFVCLSTAYRFSARGHIGKVTFLRACFIGQVLFCSLHTYVGDLHAQTHKMYTRENIKMELDVKHAPCSLLLPHPF